MTDTVGRKTNTPVLSNNMPRLMSWEEPRTNTCPKVLATSAHPKVATTKRAFVDELRGEDWKTNNPACAQGVDRSGFEWSMLARMLGMVPTSANPAMSAKSSCLHSLTGLYRQGYTMQVLPSRTMHKGLGAEGVVNIVTQQECPFRHDDKMLEMAGGTSGGVSPIGRCSCTVALE
eukprot:6484993-Amphidinium_carterae.1